MDVVAYIVKYNSQTIGRDKLCRALQYSSKLVWYTLQEGKGNPEWVAKIKKLESTVSTSRKTFRLGKSLDMFQGAVKGSRVQDPLIRLCIVGARLARTVYFIYDIFNWACRTTLLKGNSKDWAKRAAPFWFVAILFCLLRDLYEIINFHLRAKYKKENKDASIQSSLCRLPVERPDVTCDTLKNACDFLIPLNLWGKIHLSTGTVGILGLISSICGILMAANPKYKLIPM